MTGRRRRFRISPPTAGLELTHQTPPRCIVRAFRHGFRPLVGFCFPCFVARPFAVACLHVGFQNPWTHQGTLQHCCRAQQRFPRSAGNTQPATLCVVVSFGRMRAPRRNTYDITQPVGIRILRRWDCVLFSADGVLWDEFVAIVARRSLKMIVSDWNFAVLGVAILRVCGKMSDSPSGRKSCSAH